MKLTKTRARQICRLAAERLASGKGTFLCCILDELVNDDVCDAGEAATLAEALHETYRNGWCSGVIWAREEFKSSEGEPVEVIDSKAREARIIGILLLPEFL